MWIFSVLGWYGVLLLAVVCLVLLFAPKNEARPAEDDDEHRFLGL